VQWRFDGRGRWTAESAHGQAGGGRGPTYIINVTADAEFTCTSNDVNVFPNGSETMPTLGEAKEVCEARDAERRKKKHR
jgi:hypothetical protein